MVWKPKPAGPKDLREMFHWVYAQLQSLSKQVGDIGGENPGHTHNHATLTNVTPNQHHNQAHLFYGPDHTDVDTANPLIVGSTPYYSGVSWKADNLFSVAAYGGLNRSAPVAFDVTTGWTTLPLDTGLLATPRGIVQIPGSNAIQYSYSGVYKLDIGGIIQGHDSSNSGRTFFLRLYNNTEGAPISQDLAIGVGRNTEDTDFSFGTLAEVEAAALGDDIIVQIGNGDAITGGTLTGGQLATFMIGEWRG